MPALLFGFFVMGFVDLVGVATSYVKADFDLSHTLANILPMMVFVWFALFSVPTEYGWDGTAAAQPWPYRSA